MAKDVLSQQDIDHLGWLLNEVGDRTAFHLHYYELTGNEQVLAAAKISHLTDFEGAVAERANEVIQERFPDQYPQGGVFDFSRDVAATIYSAITKDFNEGTGTGVLSERGYLEAARDAWDAKGLGDQFPGNPLLATERAAEGDFRGAWDAFDSQGTDITLEAAAFTVVPDISGDPHPGLQERLENATYHLTEDGKAGYYLDRETGQIVAVFDRPSDLATEPQVDSQGILNTFTPPEPPPPDQRSDYDSYLYQPSSYRDAFDDRSESAGVNPFTAGMMGYALGAVSNEIGHHQQTAAIDRVPMSEPHTPLPDAFSRSVNDSQPVGFLPGVLPEPVSRNDEPEPQGKDFFSGLRDAVWGPPYTSNEPATAGVVEPAQHEGSGLGGFLSGLQNFALDGGQTQVIPQAAPDVQEQYQSNPDPAPDHGGWFSNVLPSWSDNSTPSHYQDYSPPAFDTHIGSISAPSESGSHADPGGSDGGAGSASGSDGGGAGDGGGGDS